MIVSLENERATNEKEDIVEKVIRSEEINGELVRSSRKGVEKAGAKSDSVNKKVTSTPVDINIPGTTDNVNKNSSRKTSTLAKLTTPNNEYYLKKFVSFKTPSSLPKVRERKRELMDKIKAKQHHGNNIDGGEGEKCVRVSTTSGDTSKVCQDQHEKVKSRDAGQLSPPVLKRLPSETS